jgi:hypothetical protein
MWTRSRFNNEYVPGLFAVMADSYATRRASSMWPQLFTVKTSEKAYEEDSVRSGLGSPVVKGEGAPITYDVQIGGGKQKWVHKVYALGVRITEEAIDDNLYELGRGGGDDIKELSADLGISMEENLEVYASRFLVSGTATTYHVVREATTYPLFYASHLRLDGSTYSNVSTETDLTYETFWGAVVAAENQYDHRQNRIVKRINTLWVPPQMEYKAIEILRSGDRPDTGNRAINAVKESGRGKIALKAWPYLSDTDAWYLQLEGDGIRFFWRRKTRFARERDFETGDLRMKADQRFSAEIQDQRCFYGVVPA